MHVPDRHLASSSLVDAIIALGRELELPAVLDKMLAAAVDNTGAPFAAINVVDEDGISVDFHFRGMEPGVWERIGRGPNAVGVLAQIPAEGALVIEEVTQHPAFGGLPKGHPPLGSFLGSALRTRNEVFGYLYLASKPGGFTPDDEAVVAALAAAASVAIENAELYKEALEREQWLSASQRITTTLLANPGDEDAIAGIIATARELGKAVSAALVLPGLNNEWVMEFTDGERADDLLGQVLPEDGFAMKVIRSGQGTVAPAPPGPTVIEPVKNFGPTLYAPLIAQNQTEGLLMLWRGPGAKFFDEHDLAIAQRFSNQAAVALQLAELAHVKNVESLLAERERIADDLHDFVSQELFATAMQLEAVAEAAPTEIAERLKSTLAHVKRAQHEVRGVMSQLQGERTSEPLAERVRREILLAQDSLGFAPALSVDDWGAASAAVETDPTLSDDICAVLRELLSNVARHAHADTVSVALSAAGGRLSVVIVDDGIGPEGATARHSGTSNLANRALRRNGTFSLVPVNRGSERPGTRAEWNVAVE